LALLFASLPIAGWLFLGGWGFPGAGELSGICFLLGLYLYFRSRRASPVPDAAAMLEEAIGLAAGGQVEEALALMTKTIRLSPHFWQAFQHRGSLLLRGNSLDGAIEDFTAAIRLAPDEAHLYTLRAQALGLLGDNGAAQKDYESAIALGGENNLRAKP
jgi:Flp pilus assembly protein TadD